MRKLQLNIKGVMRSISVIKNLISRFYMVAQITRSRSNLEREGANKSLI